MEKKIFKLKTPLFIALLILISVGVVFAINTITSGYRLNKNTVMQVRSPSYCYQTTNTGSTNDYFVPTKTDAEMTSFINHKPGDVTEVACSSLPPRIAGWSGKVNQHTDSNGVWTTDSDCSSGYGDMDTSTERITYCQKFNSETINTITYAIETITTWTGAGCAGLYTSAIQSYKCTLCSEYSASSTCTNAGCQWHNYLDGCSRFSCSSYSSNDCEEMGCYWTGSGCIESPLPPSCSSYDYAADCNNDANCQWDPGASGCYSLDDSCSYNRDESHCETDGCMWDDYNLYCHEVFLN